MKKRTFKFLYYFFTYPLKHSYIDIILSYLITTLSFLSLFYYGCASNELGYFVHSNEVFNINFELSYDYTYYFPLIVFFFTSWYLFIFVQYSLYLFFKKKYKYFYRYFDYISFHNKYYGSNLKFDYNDFVEYCSFNNYDHDKGSVV